MEFPIKKPNDPKCTCVTGQYECWHCRKPKIDAIIRNMSAKDIEYDRLANAGWRKDYDYEAESCSCHINPPCNFCTSQGDSE